MDYKTKKLAGSKALLTITITHDDFQPVWDNEFAHAREHVEIKGFRPGAVPKELADKAIDSTKVFEEALQEIVRSNLRDIGERESWIVIDAPQIEVASADKLLQPKGSLTYTATLTIFPDVALGNYRKIAAKIAAEKKEVTVTSAEVDKSFEWVLRSRAKNVLVDRPATNGDVVEIDYDTVVEGKPLPGGSNQHDTFLLGEGKFIPGFEKELESHKAGDALSFSLNVPENYWNKEVQGKKLDFSVRVKSVFESTPPAADDAFAASLGNFKTVDDVKKSIAEGLKAEKAQKETEKRRIKMLDAIVADAKIDLPEIFVEKTLDGLVAELHDMIEKGGTDKAAARESLRTSAEKRVASNLVIHEIAKQEHLEPTKEEIEEESKYHQREAKQLDTSKFYDYVYGIVLQQKVFNFLENIK